METGALKLKKEKRDKQEIHFWFTVFPRELQSVSTFIVEELFDVDILPLLIQTSPA